MDEISGTAKEIIKDRFSNNIYVNFGFFWTIFHWEFLYTALFVNEEIIFSKTGLIKNEYLIREFFDYYNFAWSNWYTFFSLVIPFLLTYIFIWKLPKKLFIPAYIEELDHKYEKQELRLSKKIEIENKKKHVAKETEERFQIENRIEEEFPQYTFEKDYKLFEKNKLFKQFDYIIESIYEQGGRIVNNLHNRRFEIPKDILAYSHSNNLIKMNQNEIELTDKGKYFVKEYQNNKHK